MTNFIEEYNKNKKKLIYGVDYVDFMFGDYLLFVPLSPIAPAVLKFIGLHNCVILTSSLDEKPCGSKYYYYDNYVFGHYKFCKEQKGFLINTKSIFNDFSPTSFISFYFKINNDNTISLGDEMYDGYNFYFNLSKLHKTKYWKRKKENFPYKDYQEFFKDKLKDILMLTVNQMLKRFEFTYDYKPKKRRCLIND